jgi:hypothetical protein
MDNVISSYTWQQAVEDGVLAEVFKDRWEQLTKGKPIIATQGVISNFSMSAIMEIWNAFVEYRKTNPNTTHFTTKMNNKTVWLIDDGTTFTIMYPEDY